MQCEQITAAVLTKANGSRGSSGRFCNSNGGSSTAAVAIQPSSDAALRPTGSQLPKYSRFDNIQSPQEFLDQLEMFCLVNDVAADERFTHCLLLWSTVQSCGGAS